jgi:hypothetical protein
MGDNNNDETYTLTHEHIEALKKRLDELKGKKLNPEDDIFDGVVGGDDITSWKIGGYYNTK